MHQARRVLFISPVGPGETGHGLAMRPGMWLEALARSHDVSLLVVPVAGSADPDAVPPWVARRVSPVVVLPPDIRSTHYELIARLADPARERGRSRTTRVG